MDRCQNKGDSKSGPNWDAKEGLRGNPKEKWVEQFEWSLITLVSLAWRLFTKSRAILSVLYR